MKELKFNLNLIFRKKEFYLFLIAMLIIVTLDVFSSIRNSIELGEYYETAQSAMYHMIVFKMDWLAPFLLLSIPIFATLSFSDSSYLEKEGKIEHLLYSRLSYKKNIIVRYIINVILVFLIVFISLLLEYFALSIIYGTVNKANIYGDSSFCLSIFNSQFLDSLRISSPNLYVLFNSLHFSILYALLVGSVYSFSFFLKKKIFIYFGGTAFILIVMCITEILNIPQFGFIYQAQWAMNYSIADCIYLIFFLFILGIAPLLVILRKKDLML